MVMLQYAILDKLDRCVYPPPPNPSEAGLVLPISGIRPRRLFWLLVWVAMIATAPPRSGGYASGRPVAKDEQSVTLIYHTGHYPGTGAFIGRRSDGIGVAVLFISDTRSQNNLLIRLFLEKLTADIDNKSSWPDHDLFSVYLTNS